jgi:hypothetical protein
MKRMSAVILKTGLTKVVISGPSWYLKPGGFKKVAGSKTQRGAWPERNKPEFYPQPPEVSTLN